MGVKREGNAAALPGAGKTDADRLPGEAELAGMSAKLASIAGSAALGAERREQLQNVIDATLESLLPSKYPVGGGPTAEAPWDKTSALQSVKVSEPFGGP